MAFIKATIPRQVTSFPLLLSEPHFLFSVLNIAQRLRAPFTFVFEHDGGLSIRNIGLYVLNYTVSRTKIQY